MIRDFTKEELQPAENHTELTLGGGAFLAIGGGLLLLCGICFGLGYVVGHRGGPDQSAAAETTVQAAVPVGSGVKPGAAGQSAAVQPQSQPTVNGAGDATGQGVEQGTAQAEQTAATGVGQAGAPATAAQAQVPRSQVQGWMVQIAAVSHPEDAQVLVDALRKRGYEVTAQRDASDSLIHVQTGPFVNRNDANAMRQKLLNDGYNAIVQ